jgi:hypothetical protein
MRLSKPVVSAVVLNYVNWEQTVETVHDLLEQTGVELDVVVVDNASPNDSFEQLKTRFGGCRRVSLTASGNNGGYAQGNNHGARRRLAAGPLDFLLIVNNDVRLPEPDAVATLAGFAAAHADAGMVGPQVVTTAGFAQGPYWRPHPLICCLRYLLPIFPLGHRLGRRLFEVFWRALGRVPWRWLGRWLGTEHGRRTAENSRPCFALVGACLLLPAAAFERAGMFDEATFLGAEEYILADRLRALGLRSYYVPAARVVHEHAQSAIRRTGGETRYLPAGVASMAYYFRCYQRAPESWIRLFELTANLYGRVFLPLRQRLPL